MGDVVFDGNIQRYSGTTEVEKERWKLIMTEARYTFNVKLVSFLCFFFLAF